MKNMGNSGGGIACGILATSILFFAAGSTRAADITINDGWANDGYFHGTAENNEVEPPDQIGQQWDLEKVTYDVGGGKTTIGLQGGYNFATGQGGYLSGDIFIDVNGDMVYNTDNFTTTGDGNKSIKNSFGYDYVVKLSWSTTPDPTAPYSGTYQVYAIGSEANLETGYYRANDKSNPWRFVDGGTAVGPEGTMSLTKSTDGEGDHYAFSVDLLGLAIGPYIGVHYTMGCGNDNLIGMANQGADISVPDSGATLALFGLSLVALGFAGRRMRA
jgi:hypothetical protein